MNGPELRPAIETRKLTKLYGGKPAVHELSLRVPTGCVYGFLGRNGAGKSTAIRMLTGMVRPDAGEARLLGEDVSQMPPEARRRIAYIAEGHPLYGWMTIDGLERFLQPFHPGWNGTLFAEVIEHFELPRRKKLRTFSNGQRAQVSLAAAIAPDPELLILDDPTLGLDTVVRRDFLESLIQIIHREGRTIFFSSHVLGDVERVADRIGIMVEGVLRVDCPLDHFRQSVRKLVLEFDGPPPEYPLRAGVVSNRSSGNVREVVIVNFGEEHHTAGESLEPRGMDVLEMNLEDAFIDYTRGERQRLPSFGGGARNSGRVAPGEGREVERVRE